MKNRHKPRLRFRGLREVRGTQLNMALKLGVTETTIRNLESGHSKPSVNLLFACARYLGTDVYDLWPDLAYGDPYEVGK